MSVKTSKLSSSKQAVISRLLSQRYFSVATQGEDLVLIRNFGGRPLKLILENVDKGKFWVYPPTYYFYSTTSHFDYMEEENRYSRRKTTITSIVRKLKESGVWDLIENKNFFRVNNNNKSMDRDKVYKEYNRVLREKVGSIKKK